MLTYKEGLLWHKVRRQDYKPFRQLSIRIFYGEGTSNLFLDFMERACKLFACFKNSIAGVTRVYFISTALWLLKLGARDTCLSLSQCGVACVVLPYRGSLHTRLILLHHVRVAYSSWMELFSFLAQPFQDTSQTCFLKQFGISGYESLTQEKTRHPVGSLTIS